MGGVKLLKAGEKFQVGNATWFLVEDVAADYVRARITFDGEERILISPSNLVVPNNIPFHLVKGDFLQIGEQIQVVCQVIDVESGSVGIRYYGPAISH
jgi:hypothetical protein